MEQPDEVDPLALSVPGAHEGVDVESPEAGTPGLTHPEAAEGVPLDQLGREEAGVLLDAVFAPVLEGLEGPFDELRPEKFLAENVAVIPAGQQPDGGAADSNEENNAQGPTLISSTIPLRVESSNGKMEVIDLSLEEVDGEFLIANPLVDVDLPEDLGDGVELPETGVSIEVEQAPEERSPSELDHNAVLYPNVAEDTDFAIAPAPTGFETLTQLRSADAPRSQTLSLDLPAGASLSATQEGGAEVMKDGEALVGISPPSALDASGAIVPVDMEVSENSLELTVSPDESTQFPVLVDPLIQSYKWEAGQKQAGIHFSETSQEEWSPESEGVYYAPPYTTSTVFEPSVGLAAYGSWNDAKKGDRAAWIYTVPRYFKELKNPPTSFISNMTLSGLTQWAGSPYASPYLTAGLWDIVNKTWVSLLSHTGLQGHHLTDTNWVYKFPNPNGSANVKVGSVGLWAMEDTPNGPGNVKVLSATVELAEMAKDIPEFNSISPPSQWMHQSPVPINFSVGDSGLGVYALTVSGPQAGQSWKTTYGCTGIGGSACPRTWSRPYAAQPDFKYDPSVLSQGTNTLKVVAEDPLGNVSAPASVPVKVDHTPPSLALSGSMTEQASIGTKWPSYTLKLTATDGTTEAPQSGVAKTVVEVDGKVVDQTAPGCSPQNCSIVRDWTLTASKYSVGQHSVRVTATDAVGLTTTKTQAIELKSALPPSATLSGTMTEQEALGASRPRYILKVAAKADPSSALPGPTSEIATEIRVSGKLVDSAKTGCVTEGCSMTHEWILDSDSYSEDEYWVQVKATDGLGRTATKLLWLVIERDTAKPTLEVSGGLFEAPEGWVEQESYGLNASADDEEYGVTSLVFKIDGKQIAAAGSGCPEGACKASLVKSIDMDAFSGGAHSAQLIATDGAGNETTKTWTVNVDPDGHVSSAEAIETLEAVDETSESAVVASTEEVLEPGQIEAGDNPGLQVSGTTIESTGTPNTTTMTVDPNDGFTIQSPDGKTTITPVVSEGSSEVKIAAGVAGVAANVKDEVDSVIRPRYNGANTFQAIRSADSPDKFSWAVNLAESQSLVLADSAHALVLYEDGSTAFLITAEEAHDATGKAVPTSLEVSGSVLTLKVDFHSAQFVFPILAGQGWETSYETPVLVERPEDEAEKKAREEEEKALAEMEANGHEPAIPSPPGTPFPLAVAKRLASLGNGGNAYVPAPDYPKSGGASISRLRTFTLDLTRCGWPKCSSWEVEMDQAEFKRGPNWAVWVPESVLHCSTDVKGAYDTLGLIDIDLGPAGFHAPWLVYKGEGKHLVAWCKLDISILAVEVGQFERFYTMVAWVWPNGFQESIMKDRDNPWSWEEGL